MIIQWRSAHRLRILSILLIVALMSASTTMGQDAPDSGGEDGCSGDESGGDPEISTPAVAISDSQNVAMDATAINNVIAGNMVDGLESATGFAEVATILGSDGGTVHLGSGELRYSVDILGLPGPTSSFDPEVFVEYRSFEVDNWRDDTADPVATIEDPFGAGWRASWGDQIILPPGGIGDVVRIDARGRTWTFSGDTVQTTPVQFLSMADATFDNLAYEGISGSRVCREYREIGGKIVPFWYREWTNGTRIEYEATSQTNKLRPTRMYRGDPSEPDWETDYVYQDELTPTIGDIDPTELDLTTAAGTSSSTTASSSGSTTTGSAAITTSVSVAMLAPAHVGLRRTVDHRGIVTDNIWSQVGPGEWRITAIKISHPTWPYDWNSLTTNFEYEATAPYRLSRILSPAIDFADDANRNGAYDADETFLDQRPISRITYLGNSNRIDRIFDDSIGTPRQWTRYTYDSVLPWRIATQTTGDDNNAPPGQGERTHVFTYPSSTDVRWTDPRGVVRTYSHITNGESSPSLWQIATATELVGPNDPRPADPRNFPILTWNFTWDPAPDGVMLSATIPSGMTYEFDWDLARRLLTAERTIPDDGGPTLSRSWTWIPDTHPDPRLRARLETFTDQEGIGGTVTYIADVNGVTAETYKDGVFQFRTREDNEQRVVWEEEAAFDVEGGGSSTRRTTYVLGTDPTQPDFCLIKEKGIGDGGSIYHPEFFTFEGPGFLSSYTDALGRTTTFDRMANGYARSVTYPPTQSGNGGQYTLTQEFVYTARGNIAIRRQPVYRADGNDTPAAHSSIETQWVYDWFGRPWKAYRDATALNSSGPTAWDIWTWTWDTGDRLQRLSSDTGRQFDYLVDDHNRIFQRQEKLDQSTTGVLEVWFDINGEAIEEIDETGISVQWTVDGYGRLLDQIDPGGLTFRYDYDKTGRIVTRETRANGVLRQTRHFDRDNLGRITQQRISSPSHAQQMVTTFTYTGRNRVCNAADESGRTFTSTFNVFGDECRRVDDLDGAGAGNEKHWDYDSVGRLTEIREVVRTEDASGVAQYTTMRETRHYDDWDRLIRVDEYGREAGVQAQRFIGYNSLGHEVFYQDTQDKITRRETDALGREHQRVLEPKPGSNAAPVVHQRTWNDNPSDPNLAQIIELTDGTGKKSEFHYDLGMRLVERRLPGWSLAPRNLVWTYTFDEADRTTGWVDGNGTVVQVDYDAEGRVSRKWVPGPTPNLSTLTTEQDYVYDDLGRLQTSRTWWRCFGTAAGPDLNALLLAQSNWIEDEFGRVTSESIGYLDNGAHQPVATKTVTSTWQDGGNEDFDYRRSIQTPSGFTFAFTPDADANNSTIGVTGPGINSPNHVTMRYEGQDAHHVSIATNSPTDRVYTDTTYDTFGSIDSVSTRIGPGLGTDPFLHSLRISREEDGGVTKLQYAKQDGTGGDWVRLGAFDRQTEWKLGVPALDFDGTYNAAGFDKKIGFNYDRSNNRVNRTIQTSPGLAKLGSYTLQPGTNQYATALGKTIVYDGNGNTVFDGTYVYKYDFLDRLTEVQRLGRNGLEFVAFYAYDTENRRIAKITDTNSSWYAWDDWRLVEEYDGSFQPVTTWLQGLERDDHLAFFKHSGATSSAYSVIQGHQRNVAKVVDHSGVVVEQYEYDPFGKRTIFDGAGNKLTKSAVGNPYGFTGRFHDEETGLIYYRNRFYSRVLGRFMTIDPIGIWGDPANWGNGYGYVGNNPSTYTDPDGEILRCRRRPRGGGRNPRPRGGNGDSRGTRNGGGNGTSNGSGGSSGRGNAPRTPDRGTECATERGHSRGGEGRGGGGRGGEGNGGGSRGGEGRGGQNGGNDRGTGGGTSRGGGDRGGTPRGTSGGDRAGKDFTPAGKAEVIRRNKETNGGKAVCEGCDTETVPPKKHEKGVTPPKNECHVDHIIPKSKGGDGSPSNGQVLCRDCNLGKGNKTE